MSKTNVLEIGTKPEDHASRIRRSVKGSNRPVRFPVLFKRLGYGEHGDGNEQLRKLRRAIYIAVKDGKIEGLRHVEGSLVDLAE